MAKLQYLRPSDNLLGTLLASAFAVESGGEDGAFPAENLGDLNVAKPAKLTSFSGRWEIDLGSAQAIDVAALIHHNLDAGLSVRLQANSVPATWGAPPLDVAFTIPAFDLDRFSINPFVDLTGVTPRTFQFWAVQIAGANSEFPALGQVILSVALRSFGRNVLFDSSEAEVLPARSNTTDLGVPWFYSLGSKWRTRSASFFRGGGGVDFADFLSLVRDANGRAEAWLEIPDPAVNDARWVRFGGDSITAARERRGSRRDAWPWVTEEVSRGLTLFSPSQ